MATSQLGNGCKSKHEGDIKVLNDKGRGGKEIRGVKVWREGWEDGIMGGVRRGCSAAFYLSTAWRTGKQFICKTLSVQSAHVHLDVCLCHTRQLFTMWRRAHILSPV